MPNNYRKDAVYLSIMIDKSFLCISPIIYYILNAMQCNPAQNNANVLVCCYVESKCCNRKSCLGFSSLLKGREEENIGTGLNEWH
jgi:hypothetical protein